MNTNPTNANNSPAVLVLGAGLVGSAIALSLAQQGLELVLIDRGGPCDFSPDAPPEQRVSAINLQSQGLLERLGVWSQLARSQPYQTMRVWDAQSSAQLDFYARDIQQSHLGTLVENRALLAALHQALLRNNKVHCLWNAKSRQLYTTLDHVELSVSPRDQPPRTLSARLLIAADGPGSPTRQQLGIASVDQDYQQQGLVCWVKAAQHHQNTAWQRFLERGPLAFLPLPNGLFSIVWSCPNEQAEQLANLEQQAFHRALGRAIEYRFGEILDSGPRACFPLRMRLAQQTVQDRLVIIGDAAHSIHPLAGQGVNLGFADVRALSEQLLRCHKAGRDIGLLRNLRPYERQRQVINAASAWAMSAIQNGFATGHPALAALRAELVNKGMSMTAIRRLLIESAQGARIA